MVDDVSLQKPVVELRDQNAVAVNIVSDRILDCYVGSERL